MESRKSISAVADAQYRQTNHLPLFMAALIIRPSTEDDLPAITAIYGHHVLHGTGTFETTPPSQTDMHSRRQDVLGKDLPYLVAERDGVAVGFAYANWFKPRPAYRFSTEDSVYVAPEHMGQGVGVALMTALLEALEAGGIRHVMAVIGDTQNQGSINLHRKMGFKEAGVMHGCGWKFNRWLDIVLMERTLGDGTNTPPVESTDHT